uniref:Uncharacterized protein n=1 Tax=viral metagenome TaxID=1070528 RepID=A0A6C0H1X3_9ZZZZ
MIQETTDGYKKQRMDTRNNGWIQETTDGYKKQRMDTRNNGWIQIRTYL